MSRLSRRAFLKTGAWTAGALAAGPYLKGGNLLAKTAGDFTFRPYPHPWMEEMNRGYLADVNDDPFMADINFTGQGISISQNFGAKRFSFNADWFVEGFGRVILSADNGGELYSSEDYSSLQNLNLNFEFARSRIRRNRDVKRRYEQRGTRFTTEVQHLFDLSEEFFSDAGKVKNNPEKCVALADKTLQYALWAGEKVELEQAEAVIGRRNRPDQVYFGCESRQLIWAKSEAFEQRFPELFNFATLTHYIWDSWYQLFEPQEGQYNWGTKDDIVKFLRKHDITIQGRPLFWFHPVVTPDWLKSKNFEQLKKYVDNHVRKVVSHYGNDVLQWEVVNEYHDWANIHRHTPEQTTEIVRLACDKTKEVNPDVVRIINNCAPWAEYAARGRFARDSVPAGRPLRSPRKFIQDLLDAGVDFDVLGIQIYFPHRDLSDIVRKLEQFEQFGKPMYITEIGATSGPTEKSLAAGEAKISSGPYEWHRRWDEELQADWLEQVYKLYYSRPAIKAINWYDFSDFRPFIVNGGLVREDVTPKRAFYRLKELLSSWNRLPKTDGERQKP